MREDDEARMPIAIAHLSGTMVRSLVAKMDATLEAIVEQAKTAIRP